MITEERLVELFFDRSENAVAELSNQYGGQCMTLASRLLRDPRDAEECVSDAYLAVWNTVPPNRPENLRAYLLRILRNLAVKRYRKNTAEKRNPRYEVSLDELAEWIPDDCGGEKAVESAELADALNGFLASLNTVNRVIFLRRYWFADSCAEIAARVGLREKNVTVRLTRLRKQLKTYLKDKGVIE